MDRPGLPPQWRLHPCAVDEVPGLPHREGAARRPCPDRTGRGHRRERERHHRHRPRVSDLRARHLPGARRRGHPPPPDRLRGSARAARLLSLDYVLEHPHLPWLPTEPEKVRAFEALGIERRLLPQRVYRGAAGNTRRHFPLRLPVALEAERAVFVYVDPGYETATALRSWGAAHRELWKALRERGRRIEVVAVARTWEELNHAQTVLGNWARDPRPSEYDADVSLEIARIEQAILKGDVRLLKEVCGDIQGGLRRMVELKERARRQAGRGLIHRTATWQSARLAGGRFG